MRSLLMCNRAVLGREIRQGRLFGVVKDGGSGPSSAADRHGSADPGTAHRSRRVALACEVVGEDHIARPEAARASVADPDFHLPCKNKNVLLPGGGVPIAEIVRRETAEDEVNAGPKRDVLALLRRQ